MDVLLSDSSAPAPASTATSAAPMKKATLGAKKKGKLGAQRLDSDFEAIETRAQTSEQEQRARASASTSVTGSSTFAESASETSGTSSAAASARFSYTDSKAEQIKLEKKLKESDPRKAEQLERLGMGVGVISGSKPGGISHSAFADFGDEPAAPVRPKASSKAAPAASSDMFDVMATPSGIVEDEYGVRTVGGSSSAFASSNDDGLWDMLNDEQSNSSSKSKPAASKPRSTGTCLFRLTLF